MSEVWPYDVRKRDLMPPVEGARAFKCLMLMPFDPRFSPIAAVIKETVREVADAVSQVTRASELPRINRVDWINESGVIHEDIWREIAEADLVFCDISGYNPNVMFEAGVCAAWKRVPHVVFIRDRSSTMPHVFDLSPIRYFSYDSTSDGIEQLRQDVRKLTSDALIAFPDSQGVTETISLPLSMNFSDGRDDGRLYTPPLAHRRVVDGRLEFGSRTHFAHSWATISKAAFRTFDVSFTARFANRIDGHGYIGVGFRSQHYWANYTHMVYLNHTGEIILVQPDESAPNYYHDVTLRGPTNIAFDADHHFRVVFSEESLRVAVDGYEDERRVADMPKVLGAGLIRFQSHLSWMALSAVHLTNCD